MTRSLFAFVAAAALAHAETPGEQYFNEKVKPLLDSRCVSCHSADKVKGGLRLDSREAALKGGENGPAVVPGKPNDSLLLQAVMHSKKDLEMPPKEKLTTNDIAVLRKWIEDGAPWPKVAAVAETAPLKPGERIGDAWSDKRNPIVRIFGGQRLDLWSLKPVKRIEPPRVSNKKFVRNPIDNFIIAKLDEKKLKPSPEADKRTLARRLYFDLIGLPPSPEEVDAFLKDKRSDAYDRLADKLLASPRYGEHQARLWMDVIRYSDSNGFDWDEFRKTAWRFRDYLIRSFNADKPFDQLVREHLAGDELFDGMPKDERDQDALIATGFLRLGPQDNSSALFNEQDRARAEWMADLTETTGSAFLGVTMSCCRCHDHKFDPFSQVDHYRLRAFFEPVKYADDVPLEVAAEQESIRRHNKELDAKLKPLNEQRDALKADVKKRLREDRLAKFTAEERSLVETPKDKRTDELKKKIEPLEKKLEAKDKEVAAAFTPEEKKHNDELTKEIDSLTKRKRSFTFGLLAADNPEKVAPTKNFYQGDHKSPRDVVQPGFISLLDPNPAEIRKAKNPKSTGRRTTLADWIASTNNPLTARVFVNRIWQEHFGNGLVATPNDFGLAGARPTHPELLDWLASDFMRGGWSVKQLHRLIVMSATYRQASSSTKTPASDNILLARQNMRRLTAEQLRDALLATAGSLKLDHAGGPPIWPDLPAEILQANPAFLDDNETKTKGWYPSPKTNQNVRSIFLVQKKTVRLPFMETFDLPENSTSCARRTESIVAPQALSLLNSSLAAEAAKIMAERVKSVAGADQRKQVERAFAFAFQRAPDKNELNASLELLRAHSLPELCRALLNANEFIYID